MISYIIIIALSIYLVAPMFIILASLVLGTLHLSHIFIERFIIKKEHKELQDNLQALITSNNKKMEDRIIKLEDQISRINMSQGIRKI